jgi:putative spermidine/putrescine transport system substrate-binding protein
LQPQKISLWAVPYKVQALVIIYRQSLFSENGDDQSPFASWRDLLQPQLRQSIALPNHPRLVIGLAQKIQSGSFNAVLEGSNKTSDQTSDKTSDKTLEKTDRQLADTLVKLNLQVKTYDSENSLKALVNEDVKAVVAWSGDAVAALKRYRDLRMFIPPEGSLLSADMWVRPKGAEMSTAAQNWIDFCWQSGPATQISVSEKGISPIFLKGDRALPETLAGGLFSTEVLQNSEPLLPIPAVLKTAYLDLWEQTRSAQI